MREKIIMNIVKIAFLGAVGLASSCMTKAPEGLKPVSGFELDKYLGKWYEIARLDHPFERGMSNVSANYSMREDGGVTVLNKGFKDDKKTWKDAKGKAYFVHSQDLAHLKVSFFGPFYGAYIVIKLDKQDYQYSIVCGPGRKYFWILSRTAKMDPELLKELVEFGRSNGFDVDKLIYVEQDQSEIN
jgi:apolipoprotein D and lipocalin family protein